MPVTWVLRSEDVARIRFAFSPMWELVASLRTLQDPARQSIHLPWIKCVRPRLAGLDLTELFAPRPAERLSGRLHHPAARHAAAGLRRRARPRTAHLAGTGPRRGGQVREPTRR